MPYFTKDFFKFFKDLEKNNNREWFNENKKRYEELVKKPFEVFIRDVINVFAIDDPLITIEPKDAIFRIYRDIRFSPNKAPYKTHAAAVVSRGGRKDFTTPGMYIELNAKGGRIYSGYYEIEKDNLQAMREHIAKNLKEFNKFIKGKKFVDSFGKVHGKQNKRIPPEFKEVFEKQPLIANKQFYYFVELGINEIFQDDIVDRVFKLYKIAKPLNNFLFDAI
ncbi:MAG: DUF2461 domain-containing protein [Ignavibacteria bacterium]|jgi:uncharacterized protein (TIGR02453 family)